MARDPNQFEKMKKFFIPLGTKMDTETPPHLLPEGTMPYMENVVDKYGLPAKRAGFTVVKTFLGPTNATVGVILGYHRAAETPFALVAVSYAVNASYGASIYEWTIGASAAAGASAWCCYYAGEGATTTLSPGNSPYYFTDHFDGATFNCATNPSPACTIITTASCYPALRYAHHGIGLIAGGGGASSSASIGPMQLYATEPFWNGRYPISYYDALHLACLTGTGYGTGNGASQYDPYSVAYGQIGYCRSWYDFQSEVRRENGTIITGAKVVGDVIILGKTDSVWQITPFLNFKALNVPYGITNHNGMVVTGDTCFVNYKGQIYQLGERTPLTAPIQTMFASEDPGNWDARGYYNSFNRELAYSIGTKLFIYSFDNQSWRMYSFNDTIKLLGILAPGVNPASAWIGAVSLHTAMTVAEEDTLADWVIQLGDNKILFQNHFNVDTEADFTETPYSMIIETPLVNCGDPDNKKRFRKIAIQGQGGPFSVSGFFSNYAPRKIPAYTALGNIALDINGEGHLNIDERFVWVALKFTTYNSGYDELATVCLHYDPKGSR